ncbi:MAG TPA: hypothetical protein VMZ49_07600 [Patescibacteria group bacterium]|nr:hypothetical protein [Patescibacteria group bacterium]
MNCPQCDCYCAPDAVSCACGYRFPFEEAAKPSPFAKQKRAAHSFLIGAAGTKSKLLRLGMLACLFIWALSLHFDDRLPPAPGIFPQLFREPLQVKENLPAAFQVTKKKIVYTITPLYHYELFGLVVSQHRSDSLLDISHRRWQDYLNIKDLCVVWGRNIRSGVYRRMKFWNRDFTCMCSFPDQETGRLFSGSHLSNNHILCVDENLSRLILRVRPGDQIHFKGYLVNYSQPANQFSRGTSTVRDDTGNGACETVYVTDFSILKRANPVWRALNPLAFLAGVAFLIAFLLA